MLVLLAELVGTVAHVGDDANTQFLSLLTLTVMLAHESHETLCQSDETDTQRTLVDDRFDGVVGPQVLASQPERAHDERELLGESRLLELHAVMELLGGDGEHVVELCHESIDTLLLVLYAHALDGHAHDVDGREGKVATSDGSLGSETVLEDTRTASHGSTLPLVALRVVDVPLLILVVRSIEVDEVGEEPACRNLAGILVEVIVAVLGQVAHPTLLLPDLDGEDGRLSATHTLVGRAQQFANDAATLGRRVRTIIDAGEHHLVTAPAVDGIHVVDESLHGLVDTSHGLVDGMLLQALLPLQSFEREVQVVLDGSLVEVAEILSGEILQFLHLFYI